MSSVSSTQQEGRIAMQSGYGTERWAKSFELVARKDEDFRRQGHTVRLEPSAKALSKWGELSNRLDEAYGLISEIIKEAKSEGLETYGSCCSDEIVEPYVEIGYVFSKTAEEWVDRCRKLAKEKGIDVFVL